MGLAQDHVHLVLHLDAIIDIRRLVQGLKAAGYDLQSTSPNRLRHATRYVEAARFQPIAFDPRSPASSFVFRGFLKAAGPTAAGVEGDGSWRLGCCELARAPYAGEGGGGRGRGRGGGNRWIFAQAYPSTYVSSKL